ncbi:MAG: hypothetical protein JXB50_09340 [Spirochaetes bacterium]|nr:hypothetical protein [Spirochaetota bacterium]
MRAANVPNAKKVHSLTKDELMTLIKDLQSGLNGLYNNYLKQAKEDLSKADLTKNLEAFAFDLNNTFISHLTDVLKDISTKCNKQLSGDYKVPAEIVRTIQFIGKKLRQSYIKLDSSDDFLS